jgi:hypothetical protein
VRCDAQKLIGAALQFDKAIVALKSPGGSLAEGITMGTYIHAHGLATLVPNDVECASVCALMWLGGIVRFVASRGRIGFHAGYDKKSHSARPP